MSKVDKFMAGMTKKQIRKFTKRLAKSCARVHKRNITKLLREWEEKKSPDIYAEEPEVGSAAEIPTLYTKTHTCTEPNAPVETAPTPESLKEEEHLAALLCQTAGAVEGVRVRDTFPLINRAEEEKVQMNVSQTPPLGL